MKKLLFLTSFLFLISCERSELPEETSEQRNIKRGDRVMIKNLSETCDCIVEYSNEQYLVDLICKSADGTYTQLSSVTVDVIVLESDTVKNVNIKL